MVLDTGAPPFLEVGSKLHFTHLMCRSKFNLVETIDDAQKRACDQQEKEKMFLHSLELVSQGELFVCDTANEEVAHFFPQLCVK